ncbi:type II secretion system protein M [Vibrio methylphosphonaticus]|uniref:type II secretion system protein M n=1 Tax=Vibrio methylphosphonaticus TaxID=2946866 RepID=UPI00202A04C9|nr:type II secretion system protein M [Vibrio methylphosphonaticus]MCL9776450.1 type II secretion system protein M [Vibrio methylphosphonaticus]
MKGLLLTAQSWWISISQREQRLVIVCSVFLILGIIYWGILSPFAMRTELAQSRIQSEKQLLSWVKEQANQITEKRQAGGVVVSKQALNQIITSSTGRFNIELIRMQPRGEELQVWIKPIPFEFFVNWLFYLQETHGVNVEIMDIDKADQSGVIDVNRLQFKRGG